MRVNFFDPDQRAREKEKSRQKDEAALSSREVAREALQHENGGYGMFRRSTLVRSIGSAAPAKSSAVD